MGPESWTIVATTRQTQTAAEVEAEYIKNNQYEMASQDPNSPWYGFKVEATTRVILNDRVTTNSFGDILGSIKSVIGWPQKQIAEPKVDVTANTNKDNNVTAIVDTTPAWIQVDKARRAKEMLAGLETTTVPKKSMSGDTKYRTESEDPNSPWYGFKVEATTRQTQTAAEVEAEYIQKRMNGDIPKTHTNVFSPPFRPNTSLETATKAGNKSELNIIAVGKDLIGDMVGGVVDGVMGDLKTVKNIFTGAGKESPNKTQAPKDVIAATSNKTTTKVNGTSGSFNVVGAAVSTNTDPSSASFVKVAKSIFTLGTTANTQAVDVYKKDGDGVIEGAQNQVKSVLSDVVDIAGSASNKALKNILGEIANVNNILTKGISVESANMIVDHLKKGILNGTPINDKKFINEMLKSVGFTDTSLNFKDGINGIKDNMMSQILTSVDGGTGLVTFINDTKKILDSKDLSKAEGIFKIIENLGNNRKLTSIMDMESEFKILNTVATNLIDMKSNSYLGKAIGYFKDIKDQRKLIEGTLGKGLKSGNLEYLEVISDFIDLDEVSISLPDATKLLVANFTPVRGEDGDVPDAEYTKLITMLNEMNPKWDAVESSHGYDLVNLEVFAAFNNEAKQAILRSGERRWITALMTSEKFSDNHDILYHLQVRNPQYALV